MVLKLNEYSISALFHIARNFSGNYMIPLHNRREGGGGSQPIN